jgi:hypothetical protein
MASYHLNIKAVSRSKGRSATAASAYRAAVKVHDERTGELHDYSRKQGLVYSEIVAPGQAPAWARDRGRLWNAAEAAEHRKNSTVAREFEIALPHELTASQRLELARRYALEIVARHRVAVDIAIHRPHRQSDERNHHAHLLCTTRRMTAEGLTEKSRELDDRKTGEVGYWRERWATMQNEHLAAYGHEARVSHLSLKEQGIDREPTRHKGPAVTAIERREQRAGVSERQQQEVNECLRIAAELGRVQRESALLNRSIIDLRTTIEAAKRQRELAPAQATEPDRQRQQARDDWAALRERAQPPVTSIPQNGLIISPDTERTRDTSSEHSQQLNLDR